MAKFREVSAEDVTSLGDTETLRIGVAIELWRQQIDQGASSDLVQMHQKAVAEYTGNFYLVIDNELAVAHIERVRLHYDSGILRLIEVLASVQYDGHTWYVILLNKDGLARQWSCKKHGQEVSRLYNEHSWND